MANTSSETFRRFTEDEEIYKPFCLVKIEDKLNIFWELLSPYPKTAVQNQFTYSPGDLSWTNFADLSFG